jgi:hypothetical protein
MTKRNLFRAQIWGALALSLALAAPAAAQWGQPRPNSGWGDRNDRYAYQNGYRAGEREGERDGRDRRDYGYKRDGEYRDADSGFRGGDKGDYRRDFRRGYEDGYDAAYRRHNRGGWGGNGGAWGGNGSGGWGNNGGNWGRPGNSGGYGRAAFDNGYRDGFEAGRDAGRRNHGFDAQRERRYRDGDRGYSSSYGSRDGYRNQYREGFRSGYERGYRDTGGRW